jgi:hypothetical protein
MPVRAGENGPSGQTDRMRGPGVAASPACVSKLGFIGAVLRLPDFGLDEFLDL